MNAKVPFKKLRWNDSLRWDSALRPKFIEYSIIPCLKQSTVTGITWTVIHNNNVCHPRLHQLTIVLYVVSEECVRHKGVLVKSVWGTLACWWRVCETHRRVSEERVTHTGVLVKSMWHTQAFLSWYYICQDRKQECSSLLTEVNKTNKTRSIEAI